MDMSDARGSSPHSSWLYRFNTQPAGSGGTLQAFKRVVLVASEQVCVWGVCVGGWCVGGVLFLGGGGGGSTRREHLQAAPSDVTCIFALTNQMPVECHLVTPHLALTPLRSTKASEQVGGVGRRARASAAHLQAAPRLSTRAGISSCDCASQQEHTTLTCSAPNRKANFFYLSRGVFICSHWLSLLSHRLTTHTKG